MLDNDVIEVLISFVKLGFKGIANNTQFNGTWKVKRVF